MESGLEWDREFCVRGSSVGGWVRRGYTFCRGRQGGHRSVCVSEKGYIFCRGRQGGRSPGRLYETRSRAIE